MKQLTEIAQAMGISLGQLYSLTEKRDKTSWIIRALCSRRVLLAEQVVRERENELLKVEKLLEDSNE